MNNANISRLKIMWVLLVTALLGSSCIGEDFEDCSRAFRLYIKAVDANQKDITQSEEIDQVLLFVFNEKEEIVRTVVLNKNDITGKTPIDFDFDYSGPRELNFVAWGNIGDKVDFPDTTSVKTLSDLYAKLKTESKNSNLGPIAQSPGDLFYGSLKVPMKYGSADPAEDYTLTISRKTSQVHIRAYGLKFWNEGQEGNYTFELRESYDSYDGNGGLTGRLVGYTPKVTMDEKGNLSTPVFNTFPTTGGKAYTLYIRHNGKVIYEANTDPDGNKFIPKPGELLNIILQFDKMGAIVHVKVVLTPWNEIFQFVEI